MMKLLFFLYIYWFFILVFISLFVMQNFLDKSKFEKFMFKHLFDKWVNRGGAWHILYCISDWLVLYILCSWWMSLVDKGDVINMWSWLTVENNPFLSVSSPWVWFFMHISEMVMTWLHEHPQVIPAMAFCYYVFKAFWLAECFKYNNNSDSSRKEDMNFHFMLATCVFFFFLVMGVDLAMEGVEVECVLNGVFAAIAYCYYVLKASWGILNMYNSSNDYGSNYGFSLDLQFMLASCVFIFCFVA